ncbi:hypothetical protein PsYK624_106140 [Phanerochaete sordida]|uniref:Protein kinase domain-containing protein n=1 Tax=Phanerochaete sordida TaxID=48140 RepID=A0A9P3GIZ4_9APHY|nr:hypothetical protein PsYK624_106140 [Phanerochaete sordida]
MKELEAQGDYVKDTKRWKWLPQDTATLANENIVFRSLMDIASAIDRAFKTVCAIGQQEHVATTWLVMESDRSPAYVHRKNTMEPDCTFVCNANEDLCWVSIASCGEFMRKDNVGVLNAKTMWNLHHLMREDPRRRFAYSFTVENCTMRLWFCNRSTYAISESFDFCSEPDYIVHYFLALMYATEAQLGWDTTMVTVDVDGEQQYDITVDDTLFPGTGESRVYRTSELLSDVATFAVRGRATRVWRAKLLQDGKPVGEDVAIRDHWIDEDKPREATVLENIIADVPLDLPEPEDGENFDEKRSRNLLRKHLLTIIASGDVVIDGAPDFTLPAPYTLTWFDIQQKDTRERAQSRRDSELKSLQEEIINHHEDVYDMIPIPPHHPEQYHVKAHHRIVYEEVCTPLNAVKALDDVLWNVSQAAAVLALVHSAGWVHRDISSGNILIYEGKVKIADFEYAKKFGFDAPADTQTHDLKTGTGSFMSIEVSCGEYCFTPRTRESTTSQPTVNLKRDALEKTKPQGKARASVAYDPFHAASSGSNPRTTVWRYTPLNDMESLWWLATFFVFDKDVIIIPRDPKQPIPSEWVEPEDDRRARLLLQSGFSVPIFHQLEGLSRANLLGLTGSLVGAIPRLHPYLRDTVARNLEDLRNAIVECYCRAERNLGQIDRLAAWQPLYTAFATLLTEATGSVNNDLFTMEMRSLASTIRSEKIKTAAVPAGQEAAPEETTGQDNGGESGVRGDGEGGEEGDEEGDGGRRKRARVFRD